MALNVEVAAAAEHELSRPLESWERRTEPSARGLSVKAVVLLVLPAVLAAGLLLFATRHGEDTEPDSAAYTGTAHSLATGHGFKVPIHFYPLGRVGIGIPPANAASPAPTPLVVYAPLEAALLAPGDHPVGAARAENVTFFALAVLLVGLLVLGMSGSLWMAVAAELVVAFQRITELLAQVQTTTPALLLALVAIAAVMRYRHRPSPGWLVVAVTAMGLGLLERYAAGGVVVWAVIALWYRHRTAITVGVLSVLPLGGWFAYEQATGASSGHSLGVHFVTNSVRSGTRSISDWILPTSVGSGIAAVAAVAVVAGTAVALRRGRRNEARLVVAFAVVQLVFLEVASIFVDAGVSLEPRELVPIFAAVVIALAASTRATTAIKALAAALAGAAVISSLVAVAHHEGQVYSATKWTHSRLMADVRALPTDTVIFTNAPDALYLLTGRATSSVPETQDFSTLKANQNFRSQIQQMTSVLRARHGVIVYVRNLPGGHPNDPSSPRDAFLPNETALKTLIPLTAVHNEADGAIYQST